MDHQVQDHAESVDRAGKGESREHSMKRGSVAIVVEKT